MDLSDRIKGYEDCFKTVLPSKLPVIIRIDGSNFSKLTSSLAKPYDDNFIELMNNTAKYVISEVSGTRFCTVQSDEINIFINNYESKDSQPWYGNSVNKINTLCASLAASYFSVHSAKAFGEVKVAQFDSRCFVVPQHEVFNYFYCRQLDTTRNAIQMFARTLFSHKELNGKSSKQMQEMCLAKGSSFDDLPVYFKRGRSIYKVEVDREVEVKGKMLQIKRREWFIDNNSPVFVEDRNFIEKYI